LFIGGITGAIEISITFPTEYTKTVMQLYPELNKQGTIATVKQTYAERGILGFYRGYGALLMFSVPKNYVRFGTYSYMKSNVLHEPTKLNNFMCGIAAGAAESTFVVTP
jgi:solute carrier family 25 (mitochondrial citrate transporter), member 1